MLQQGAKRFQNRTAVLGGGLAQNTDPRVLEVSPIDMHRDRHVTPDHGRAQLIAPAAPRHIQILRLVGKRRPADPADDHGQQTGDMTTHATHERILGHAPLLSTALCDVHDRPPLAETPRPARRTAADGQNPRGTSAENGAQSPENRPASARGGRHWPPDYTDLSLHRSPPCIPRMTKSTARPTATSIATEPPATNPVPPLTAACWHCLSWWRFLGGCSPSACSGPQRPMGSSPPRPPPQKASQARRRGHRPTRPLAQAREVTHRIVASSALTEITLCPMVAS